MNYYIQTFGCQMNVNDSEKIRFLLNSRGFVAVETVAEAKIVIINTCAVRAKARDKVFSYIGRLSRDQVVIIAGCVAQAERGELLRRNPRIHFVVGTHQFDRMDVIVSELLKGGDRGAAVGFSTEWKEMVPDVNARVSRVTGYISIMEGCNNFCSYCIVPFTRGREKHRPGEAILREAHYLADQGFSEIVLLGQNVNNWVDPGTGDGFADLLLHIAEEVEVKWIRFITSYPGYHDPKLIGVMADHPRIARHVHFPAQSGSTRVLRRMKRVYTRQQYLSIVENYAKAIPGMRFSSDFIVGFPGETDHDFKLTLSLLRRVEYESVFSFAYSPRPFTRAVKWPDDVPLEVKKDRLHQLQALQNEIQLRRNREWVGRELQVLVTGPNPRTPGEVVARSESYRVVNLQSSAPPGAWLNVRVQRAGPYSLRAVETGEP